MARVHYCEQAKKFGNKSSKIHHLSQKVEFWKESYTRVYQQKTRRLSSQSWAAFVESVSSESEASSSSASRQVFPPPEHHETLQVYS
jgi:hypothetical protein